MKSLPLFILSLLAISYLTPTAAWEYKPGTENPDYCYPDQVHISLGDAYYNSWNNFTNITAGDNTNSSVIIVWQTQHLCDNFYVIVKDEKDEKFSLKVTAGEIWNELQDQPVTKEKNKIEAAGRYVSYSHTAYISGLKTGHFYNYQIFQGDTSVSVGPFRFTLPEMSSKQTEKPVKFALYADIDTVFSNYTMDAFKSLHQLTPFDISFHLFLGDLGYDMFSENGKRGEYFYNAWQPLLASYPFMVTPGNHEIYTNYSFLNMRTRMPLYNKTSNHYFSFNVGKAHILAINYYFYRDNPAHKQRMFDWIEADLKAAVANRAERPWIFIATHQPIYCSLNAKDDQPDKRCYNFYERYTDLDELFNKYKVDMVLQGHVHNWERMGPTYKNKSADWSSWSEGQRKTHMANPQAPIYTIEGAAGNSYFMAGHTPLANYSINVDSTLSFSTVTIINGTALKYEHINSQNGNVMDYFYVLKGDEYPYPPVRKTPISPTYWVAGALVGVIVIIAIYLKRRSDKRKGDMLTRQMLSSGDRSMLDF